MLLPLVWKSFAAVYTADVAALAGLYAWKEAFPWSDPQPQEEEAAAAMEETAE